MLTTPASVLATLVAGGCAALASLGVRTLFGLDPQPGTAVTYLRPPVIEETLKASILHRVLDRSGDASGFSVARW